MMVMVVMIVVIVETQNIASLRFLSAQKHETEKQHPNKRSRPLIIISNIATGFN